MTIKNITFTADEHMIDSALERVNVDRTTLNEQFRLWLKAYVGKYDQLYSFDATSNKPRGKLKVGRKLTRDEMNER